MGRGHTGHNPESYEGFTQYVLSHRRPFLCECHISFYYIFAVREVRAHELWRHLKMCVITFGLLSFILSNGIVCGEMRSQVVLMPMVIKFGPSD